MKKMKIFFNLSLLFLFCWGTTNAQSADPSIGGANFVANSVEVGEIATLEFNFVNTGFSDIPTNSIELTIVMADNFYKTDGVNPPSGPGSGLFNWVYLGSDIWRGTNNTAIGAFGGGDISIPVKGIQASDGFQVTNINVQPVANFNAFKNEPSNDNQQPGLKIEEGTGPAPCASVGGIGAACTDSNGNASTIGTDCNCIDLGPCYAEGGIGAACTDVNGKSSTIGADCNCIEVVPACTVGDACVDVNGAASFLDAACNCIEVIPACTVGDACVDVNGTASVLGADCNCIEVDNGVGTDADPAVSGANYDPNEIEVGAKSTLTISFANTGSSAIPANSIDLTINTANNFYTTDGTTAPTGSGGDLFTWNYLGADIWRGRNNTVISAYGGGTITLEVMGTNVSAGFEATNINVQPIAQFGAFRNESSNDNLQPELKINSTPIDCDADAPVLTLVSATSPTCAGGSDGAIVVEVSYIHAMGTEQWTGGPTTRTWDNLSAGDYTFTATDAEGCFTSATYTLTDPAAITGTATNVVAEECTTFGSATLVGNGGTAPYTFSGDLTAGSNGSVSDLSAGTYAIVATDADGCTSAPFNLVIANNCGCTDEDKDGVCAQEDCDDNDPFVKYGPGSACDDGNDCTENDVYDANCDCVGTPKTTAPVLVGVPNDVTVACNAIPSPANVTSGSLSVGYLQNRTGDNDCNYKLTRTWTVTDACGNTTTVTQMITVIDDKAPVLVGVPSDITVNVNLGQSLPVINVTATDDCDPNPQVITALPSIIIDPCSNQVTYSQSWVAIDECGNASDPQSHTVTIINDNYLEDADNDGVCDEEDACPNDPSKVAAGVCGCGVADIDSDNDGVLDCNDACPGSDDSIDADKDGIPDGCEQCDGSLTIVRKELRNVACYGGNDGRLVIEIQGGDGPYVTSWSNGSSSLFNSNLTAGSYTVTVKDVNDCVATATYTITAPAELVVSLVSITPENCAANTGAIDIEVSGGTAPYSYNWIAYASTQDLSGLNARDYILEVTDAKGCKSERMTYTVPKDCGCDNVTYGGKIGFGSNCNYVPTICAGAANPLIGSCALPTGGSGTLEYVWLMSTTCPNRLPNSVNNDPDWSVVPNSNRPTLQLANLTQTTCFIRCARRAGCEAYIGESNIVKVIVDGNLQTWYADKDNDGYGDPNDFKLSCTQPNGYVGNDNDCDDDNASIPAAVGSDCDDGDATTENDKIQGDRCTCQGEPIAPSCPTASIVTSDGKVTISGLTAPRNFVSIYKGSQNQLVKACSDCDEMVMFELTAGNYRVMIQFRDQYGRNIPGCNNIIKSITITTACVDVDKDGVCADDDCDDDNPNIGAKQPAGTYCDDGDATTTDDKILSDGCSCQGTPIPTCDLMVEELNITNPTCEGRNDGVVAIVATNGVGPYQYKWSNGRTGTNGIAGLLAGDYTISITDANGCSLVKTYSLVNPDPIMAVETIVDATCGNANGAISLVVSGGVGDYKYFWNGVESTRDQANLAAGTYTVRIRDNNYCQSEFTYTVGNVVTDACDPGDDTVVECGKATITYGSGKLTINVIPADKDYRFQIQSLPTYAVLNDESCDYGCGAMHMVNLAEGDYRIRVFENNEWSTAFCETFITMGDGPSCTDNDGDGVCAPDDCDDNNPNVRGKQTPGTSCDDGNANTENDRVTADGCGCAGTPIVVYDCPALGKNKGDSCDDGDSNTENDVVTANCECAGTPIVVYDCPTLGKNKGDSCDDGDSNTENDVVTDNCQCAGTPIQTGEPNCDNVTAVAGDGTITVYGLTSPIEHVKVYLLGAQNSLTQKASCVGDCGDTWVAEGLAPGNYVIHFTLRNRQWASICANGGQDLPIYVTVESGASASSRNNEGALSINPTDFKVYPNPARDEAFINLSDWTNQSVDLVIHNHFSQVVFEQHIEQVSASPARIDLTSFTNGLYYIQVKTKGQRPVTKKLMVTRLY